MSRIDPRVLGIATTLVALLWAVPATAAELTIRNGLLYVAGELQEGPVRLTEVGNRQIKVEVDGGSMEFRLDGMGWRVETRSADGTPAKNLDHRRVQRMIRVGLAAIAPFKGTKPVEGLLHDGSLQTHVYPRFVIHGPRGSGWFRVGITRGSNYSNFTTAREFKKRGIVKFFGNPREAGKL